ncbi:MAG TPA: ABC transporter transmembrane domain-containing protein [Ktedonobacteraceae bacterium]|nr:ABC transporter transmembrane domain-containing protein [Ktedonobacteraceae bacterium]
MVRFLFRNLKGYRFLVFLALFMAFAQVITALFTAFPLKFILDKFTSKPTPNNPTMDPRIGFLDPLIRFFDNLGGANTAHMPLNQHTGVGIILFSATAIVVLGILNAILAYFELFLASYIAQNLTARLRKQLFSHLERLSLDWHGKQKKGDLVQRITGNIADIEKLVTDGMVDLLTGLLTIIGVVTVMLLVNWQFTVLSVVIIPALVVVVFGYTTGIKAASKRASKAAGQVANVATEDIGNITVLKAFTLEDREAQRFHKYVTKNREAGLRAGGLQAQFTPIVGVLVAIGTAIIVGTGSFVASNHTFHFLFLTIPAGTVTFGTLTVFLSYLGQLYQPLRDLSKLTNVGTAAASGAERIQEVLDAAPEVVDTEAKWFGPTRFKGDILFENVVFSYSPNQPVLKGIDLHIASGKRVALVGLSGGGKTTLVKLISRFYEIQQGAVRIDGIDNRAFPLALLRQNVSMVLQDNVLFEGTIHENIAIGKPGAAMEEIIEAAKKAYVHDTIMSMPDAYETEVREQGKNFSGGQRQRLAIARAVLRDAPILILDEPTAALDVEAEAEVMHALDTLVAGRTVLMISHRLTTLGNVDDIIVLKDGRIVEQGTFKELKKKGGVFAGLLEEQNRYNLDRAGNESILRPAFAPILLSPDQYQVIQPAAQPFQRGTPPPATPVPGWSPPSPQPVPVGVPAPPNHGGAPITPRGFANGGGQPAPPSAGVQQPRQGAGLQKARILVEIDGKVVSERRLDKQVMTIGRLSGNDIQVPSQRVSRLHAKIRWENGAWIIEDAESLNGLVYKGQLVERLPLKNGDRVHVAPTAVVQYVTP